MTNKKKPKFAKGEKVYSPFNKDHKMEICFVQDTQDSENLESRFRYKLTLKTDANGNYKPDGLYSQSSKWLDEDRLSNRR